jgi:hypothetical protein
MSYGFHLVTHDYPKGTGMTHIAYYSERKLARDDLEIGQERGFKVDISECKGRNCSIATCPFIK